jgi:hypothetical protein
VAHAPRHVFFIIHGSGYEAHHPFWDNLFDKHNSPPPAVFRLAPNVETQIDFVEIAVKWNPQAEELRVKELKANDADKCLAVPRVEFRSLWHEGPQHLRADLEVEHQQVSPFGGQEFSRLFGHGNNETEERNNE